MKPVIVITTSTDGTKFMLNKAYSQAVEAAGGVPVMLPYLSANDVTHDLSFVKGIILSGGGDIHAKFLGEPLHPLADAVFEERDEFELALCGLAFARNIPLLGICRGSQLLNVAAGGGIIQHIEGHSFPEKRTETVHTVTIKKGTMLHSILNRNEMLVNSMHHQAVNRLGNGVVVTAVAQDEDGINVIEGIELPEMKFAQGVQWHPEALCADHAEQRALFEAFINAAKS